MEKNEEKNNGANIWIASAIVFAGLLVAISVIVTNGNDDNRDNNADNKQENTNEVAEENNEAGPIMLSDVTEDDYIRGSIDAPIKIVEFSDTECPFCKRIHQTLKQVRVEYPEDVAWVYRHLPILQLHPKALPEAIAAECAGEQAGNEGFWTMLDRIYEETPGNNRLDLAKLPEFAKDQGLNTEEFNQCLESGRYEEKINKQIAEAFSAGAKGTPFSIIITPKGDYIPVSGAQPIEVWRNTIDTILEQEI